MGFDFLTWRGFGVVGSLRIAMVVGDTSYLASKFHNTRTEDYKSNSHTHRTSNIYNSVGPKSCIAAQSNWLSPNYLNSVVAPAFPPNSTAHFRFFFDSPPSNFLNQRPFKLPIPHAHSLFFSPTSPFRSIMSLLMRAI